MNADRTDDRPDGSPRPPRLSWLVVGAVASLFLVIGAVAGAAWMERRVEVMSAPTGSPSPDGPARRGGGHADHGATGQAAAGGVSVSGTDEALEVSISAEAAQRIGIRVAEVRRQRVTSAITVPGTIASNAYRETKVNALVGGIVREVRVELGAPVRPDEPLAVIFSNELADAQMRYLSLRALLRADQQKLERTRRLTEIGAASRQELEEVTAGQAARATELAAARQRLQLLGLTRDQVDRLTEASQIVSELTLVAPAAGAVIGRAINPGQVIGPGQELFVVADLSTVWVIGDLYEKDFAAVRVGTPAAVTLGAAPGRALPGRVTYIDPRVDPATRTAKVRVEVANPTGALRLGMFAQVAFDSTDSGVRLAIPRSAVQAIGERNVVYVATEDEGRFQERTVRLGASVADAVEVVEGLKAGERVVSEGSFFLRAEAGRARNAG